LLCVSVCGYLMASVNGDDIVQAARVLRDRLAAAVDVKQRHELNQAALMQQLAVASANNAQELASRTARLERAHVDALAHFLRAVVDVDQQHAELHSALLDAQAAAAQQKESQKESLSHSSRSKKSRKSNPNSLESILSAANAAPVSLPSAGAAAPPIPPLEDAPPVVPRPIVGNPLPDAGSAVAAPPLPQTPRV
jgi:hypothetical protein